MGLLLCDGLRRRIEDGLQMLSDVDVMNKTGEWTDHFVRTPGDHVDRRVGVSAGAPHHVLRLRKLTTDGRVLLPCG